MNLEAKENQDQKNLMQTFKLYHSASLTIRYDLYDLTSKSWNNDQRTIMSNTNFLNFRVIWATSILNISTQVEFG